jgi:hypothetical protein
MTENRWRPSFKSEFKKDIEKAISDRKEIPHKDAKSLMKFATTRLLMQLEGIDQELSQTISVDRDTIEFSETTQHSSDLPEKPGIYQLRNDNNVLYIGQSNNIKNRCQVHTLTNGKEVNIDYQIIKGQDKRIEEERKLIKELNPTYNTQDNTI